MNTHKKHHVRPLCQFLSGSPLYRNDTLSGLWLSSFGITNSLRSCSSVHNFISIFFRDWSSLVDGIWVRDHYPGCSEVMPSSQASSPQLKDHIPKDRTQVITSCVLTRGSRMLWQENPGLGKKIMLENQYQYTDYMAPGRNYLRSGDVTSYYF